MRPTETLRVTREAEDYCKMDLGQRVVATAKTVTPDECAELLAVRLANMHASQTPTHGSHWRGDGIFVRLVKEKIILPESVPDWPRGWKRARLTEFGERVLLHIAEEAMVQAGRMVSMDGEASER
jgi:hypothetical protein